jgi:hypothetical protein
LIAFAALLGQGALLAARQPSGATFPVFPVPSKPKPEK